MALTVCSTQTADVPARLMICFRVIIHAQIANRDIWRHAMGAAKTQRAATGTWNGTSWKRKGMKMGSKKRKQISQKERHRRERQRQAEYLYTPDGCLLATKIKHGYKLHNNRIDDNDKD
jgi:hypothetical protein